MQKVIREVAWKEKASMCLGEAEMEDASEIKIDQLIDIKELDSMDKENKLVAIDDASAASFSEQSFFLVNPMNKKKGIRSYSIHKTKVQLLKKRT